MKDGKLRIGNKGKEGTSIRIPFSIPETREEWEELFGDNEQFLFKMAERGVRIHVQDLFRETVSEGLKAGKSPEAIINQVLDELQTVDLTAKKERAPSTRKPKEVVVPKDKATFSRAELDALLAKHGVKTVTEGQQPVAATPAAAGTAR